MKRELVEQLNNLSLEIFGSKRKWQKMIEKGVSELVVEDTKRMSIKDGVEGYEIVKTPVMHKDQLHQYTLRKYTPESVLEFMLNIREERRKNFEKAMKEMEEKRAAEAAKEAVAGVSGSSI